MANIKPVPKSLFCNNMTSPLPFKRLFSNQLGADEPQPQRRSSASAQVFNILEFRQRQFFRPFLVGGALMLCLQLVIVTNHHRRSPEATSIENLGATGLVERLLVQEVAQKGAKLEDRVPGNNIKKEIEEKEYEEEKLEEGDYKAAGTEEEEEEVVKTAVDPLRRPFSPMYQHNANEIISTRPALDLIFQPKASEKEYFQWVPPQHGTEAVFLQIRPDLGVAVGGYKDDYSTATATLQFLNLTTSQWTSTTLPEGIAETHNAVTYDENQEWLYIVSGQKGGACLPATKAAARVHVGNPNSQNLTFEYLPDLPEARYGSSAAIVTDESSQHFLHVFGGVRGENRRDIALDHWRLRVYPTLGHEWETLSGPPDAGLHAVAKVYNNSIYYTAFASQDFALFPRANMKKCRENDFKVSDAHHVVRHGLLLKYNASASFPTWERLQDMPLALCQTASIIYRDQLFVFGGVQTQVAFAGGPTLPERVSQAFDFRTQEWYILSNLTEMMNNAYIWIDSSNSLTLMRPHEYQKKGKKRPYSKMIQGKFLQTTNGLDVPNQTHSKDMHVNRQLNFLHARKSAVRRETSERFLACLKGVGQSPPDQPFHPTGICHPFWFPTYQGLRRSWNHYYDPLQHPDLVCKPRTESQVSTIVTCARRGGQALCARSGKHSFSGDTCTYGVVVDVTEFKDIMEPSSQSNASTHSYWRMGAGNTLGRVSFELHQRGYVLPSGHCPSVGLTGLILAGGQGPLTRLYGMTSDFVAGVRYVDWQGNIVEAMASNEYKDALWLARGGGSGQGGVFSFPGIILEWYMQDIPELIAANSSQPVFTTISIQFSPTLDNAEMLMENYQDFLLDKALLEDPYINHLTVEVWIANWVKQMPDQVPENKKKGVKRHKVLKAVAYFYGDDDMNQHAETHFYPRVRALAKDVKKSETSRQTYLDFQRTIGGVGNNQELTSGHHGWNLGDKWKGYSAVASDKVPGSVFRELAVGMWDTKPQTYRYTEIKPLRGSISTNLGELDSAFWHRHALFWSLSSHFWKAPESSQYVQNILRESSQIHRRYEVGMGEKFAGSYAGYMDPGSTVPHDLERYNGGNAAKAAAVRKSLDPSNVFRLYLPNNGLATASAV